MRPSRPIHPAPASRPARRPWAAAAVLLLGLCAQPAWPEGGGDHERARRAVLAGEVLPLPAVLERLQREQPGQVLEVELEQERGRWVYEIRLLRADGQLLKLELDAASGAVLRSKSRGAGARTPSTPPP